jgi:hypothetical protein
MRLHGDPTLFGDPADFAIEAGVEPDLTPPSPVWGHMRVWCGGIPLGDIDDRHCGLYLPYLNFRSRARSLDELWDENLTGLSDREIWNFLDGRLYGFHGDVEIEDDRTLDEVDADMVRYGKFNFLTNWGEQFDGYKSFLLCPPGKPLRVLCRRLPERIGLGLDVSRAGFTAASRAFVRWFEEQERRLRPQRE